MTSKNTQEDEIIEYIDEEQDDSYSDDDLYNISSWGADLSFRELVQRYKDGDLVKPEIQRNYVWDKVEASRFIDSLLLGLPVPSIFLAKTTNEKMLIVDGYQRIMTVFDYVEEKIFRTDGKLFRLTNSKKINQRWRGKSFDELTEAEQRKIRNTTIHCIIFIQLEPRESDTSLAQVFERINTSGRTLTSQEIRNCVYQGEFNKLLINLNENTIWRKLYGLPKPDSRMRDTEFVLRFFALNSKRWNTNDTGSISLKKFLHEFMGNKDAQNKKILQGREVEFEKIMQFIDSNYSEDVFQNISKSDPTKSAGKFNPTIYDSIMIATQIALAQDKKINFDGLEQKRLTLLRNPDYQDLVRFRTTNEDRIAKRINMALETLYGLTYE